MTAMTEAEAREKWCPMARAYDGDESGGATATNRPLAYREKRKEIRCIADRCMAWRWAISLATSQPTSVGYCGAFGRPEA